MNNICTSKKAAEILGVSSKTVQLWARKGILESWKTVGGHRRFCETKIEKVALKLTGNEKLNKSSESNFVCEEQNIQKKSEIIFIGKGIDKNNVVLEKQNITHIENHYTGIIELTRKKYDLIVFLVERTQDNNLKEIIKSIISEVDLIGSKIIFLPINSNQKNIQTLKKNELEIMELIIPTIF